MEDYIGPCTGNLKIRLLQCFLHGAVFEGDVEALAGPECGGQTFVRDKETPTYSPLWPPYTGYRIDFEVVMITYKALYDLGPQ